MISFPSKSLYTLYRPVESSATRKVRRSTGNHCQNRKPWTDIFKYLMNNELNNDMIAAIAEPLSTAELLAAVNVKAVGGIGDGEAAGRTNE